MDDLAKLFSDFDLNPQIKRNPKKVGFLLFFSDNKKKRPDSRIVYEDNGRRYYNYKNEMHGVPPYPLKSKYIAFTHKQKKNEKAQKAAITRAKNKEIRAKEKAITAQQKRLKKEAEKIKKKRATAFREKRRQRRNLHKIKAARAKERGEQAEAEMGDLTSLFGKMGGNFSHGRLNFNRKSMGRSLKKSMRRIRKSSRRRRKSSRRIRKSSRRRRKSSRRIRKSSRRRRKSSRKSRKSSSCKRRRVRKNADGTLNEEDMAHNAKCYNENFLKDNPWMSEPWALKQVPHPEKHKLKFFGGARKWLRKRSKSRSRRSQIAEFRKSSE